MFGLGMGEIVVILIVALLFIGPEQLPKAAKTLGKGLRELRKHTRDLQETVESDETIGGSIRDLRSALRGDDLPPAQPHVWAKNEPPASPPAPHEGAIAQGTDVEPEPVKPEGPAEPPKHVG
jgi:sec-independent protein translocase protein TatB